MRATQGCTGGICFRIVFLKKIFSTLQRSLAKPFHVFPRNAHAYIQNAGGEKARKNTARLVHYFRAFAFRIFADQGFTVDYGAIRKKSGIYIARRTVILRAHDFSVSLLRKHNVLNKPCTHGTARRTIFPSSAGKLVTKRRMSSAAGSVPSYYRTDA